MYATVATLLCLFFFGYRRIRGDSQTFKDKIIVKNKGLKANYNTAFD